MIPYSRYLYFSLILALLFPMIFAGGSGEIVEIEANRAEVLWQYTKEDSEATFWKLEWSPDGKYIAATFFDNKCIILNAEDGTMYKELDLSVPTSRCDGFAPDGLNPLRACSFSPDGKYLAVGGDDLVVTVFNTETWDVEHEFWGHTGSILALDFSPDSRYIASGSGTDKVIQQNAGENQTRIWDIENNEQVMVLGGHRDGVLAVKWSNEGTRIATASDDRRIRIWDFPSGEELLNTTGHTTGILDLDWSPDDSLLITGSRDYKIKVWNSTTGEVKSTWSDHNCVRSVDVHPGGEIVATSGVDLTLKIRDMGTGTELKVLKEGIEQHAMVMSSRWSPDGKYIASGLGKSHTVILYGFGAEDTGGKGIDKGLITGAIMGIIGIVFMGILYIPLVRQIRRRRP